MKRLYFIFTIAISFILILAPARHAIFSLVPEEKQPPQYQMRTVKNFVFKQTSDLVSPGQIDQNFSFFISETVPAIKSGFIEIRGIAIDAGASPSITASIDDSPLLSPRVKSFSLNTGPSANQFRFLYDITSYISPQVTGSGDWPFLLSVKANDITLSVLSARLYLTYQFTPPVEGIGFPANGELISPAFDTTGISDGPAYNSIMWKGVLGGTGEDQGRVRFQLAASDCANGAADYPACSSGTWSFAGGSTCGSNDWFEPGGADLPEEIKCYSQFNNKRYFKYKAQICSDDCVSGGNFTPRVDDIVVSWSP